MAGAGVAARVIDLLQNDGRSREAEARAAVGLRNEGGQPPGLGQGCHELLGVASLGIDSAEVLVWKAGAQTAHVVANICVILSNFHGIPTTGQSFRPSSRRRAARRCAMSIIMPFSETAPTPTDDSKAATTRRACSNSAGEGMNSPLIAGI